MPFPRSRLLLALAPIDVLVLYVLAREPKGQAHVWVFPQGEGLVIVGPQGHVILMDGPASSADLVRFVGRVLPPLGANVDLVVLTRVEDGDLWTAQAALFRRYRPGEGWAFPTRRTSAVQLAWGEEMRGRAHGVRRGEIFQSKGLRVTVEDLTPPALRVDVGRLSVIYAPRATWRGAIPAYGRGATLWIVGTLDRLPPAALLAPHVILTSPDTSTSALGSVILSHPETTFYLSPEVPFHLQTDGARYRVVGCP